MKSEFYWGFLSSLIVAVAMTLYQFFSNKSGTIASEPGSLLVTFAPGLLPFIIIYFIAGVTMLFNKKSELFAKGILLTALLLFLVVIVSYQDWIKL